MKHVEERQTHVIYHYSFFRNYFRGIPRGNLLQYTYSGMYHSVLPSFKKRFSTGYKRKRLSTYQT